MRPRAVSPARARAPLSGGGAGGGGEGGGCLRKNQAPASWSPPRSTPPTGPKPRLQVPGCCPAPHLYVSTKVTTLSLNRTR